MDYITMTLQFNLCLSKMDYKIAGTTSAHWNGLKIYDTVSSQWKGLQNNIPDTSEPPYNDYFKINIDVILQTPATNYSF